MLNSDGSVKEEYQGQEAYVKFAKKHSSGDMQKAYKNASAVLGGVHNMRELGLGWKQFQGTVSQFEKLQKLFKLYEIEELSRVEGQKKVAKEVFKGDIVKTYKNVSVLRELLLGSLESFKELNWKRKH